MTDQTTTEREEDVIKDDSNDGNEATTTRY
jgi:hypothetical protein